MTKKALHDWLVFVHLFTLKVESYKLRTRFFIANDWCNVCNWSFMLKTNLDIYVICLSEITALFWLWAWKKEQHLACADMNSPGLTGRKWKRLYFTWLGGSVIHPISNQWPCCCSSSKQRELDLSQTRVELLFHRDLIAFLGLIDSVWKWSELLNSRNGINITWQDGSWSVFQSLCTCTAFHCWTGCFEYK